jgi:hypothetical protein
MKNNIIEANKMMRHEFERLGDGRKAFLRPSPKPGVIAFGGKCASRRLARR